MKQLLACLMSLAIADGALASERPAPTAATMPDTPELSVCSRRASRDALLADASARINAAFEAGLARTGYARDLAAWKLERLAEGAGLSASDAAALRARFQEEASASDAGRDENTASAEFIAAAEAFDDARARGRARDACRALTDVLAAITHVVETTEARWRFLAARYDAEAARRGVMLD